VGKTTYSVLYGTGFYNYLSAFDAVYAHAVAGGNDLAILYDSAGNDYLLGQGNLARLNYGSGLFIALYDFDSVVARATAGGNDTKHLEPLDPITYLLSTTGSWIDV